MIEQLTSTDFEPYLHRSFSIRLDDDATYALELIEVRELGEPRQTGARRPFSLFLRSPRSDAYLPQRIYRLEFEPMPGSRVGEILKDGPSTAVLDLFIVPLGPDRQGMNYEIIFT